MVYFYMITNPHLVRTKVSLWVTYISDLDITRGSRTTGSGPADNILVSTNTYGPSKKIHLWYIPNISVIYEW